MRARHKEWKNNRANGRRTGPWTRRVIWYQGADRDDIRLSLEDLSDRQMNAFPKSREQAGRMWDAFKKGDSVPDVCKIA